MDFSKFEYHKDKVPKDRWEQEEFFSELRQKFLDEVKQSEIYKEYLEKYDESSMKAFAKSYADTKSRITKLYEYYHRIGEEAAQLRFRKDTENALRLIKHKKLFNLQLQWRAEKIKIKEINICRDFMFWGDHVDECPFIPEITNHEISLMKQYMKKEGASELFHVSVYEYQDYDMLVEKDENGLFQNMPDWYDFYDTMTGTSSLLLLPDIRGAKEDYYMGLGRKALHKENLEKQKKEPKKQSAPQKPSIWAYDDDEMFKFMNLHEKDEFYIELFRCYKIDIKKRRKTIDRFDLHQSLHILDEAETEVIMPGGKTWDEAIVECAMKYKGSVIAKELDILYEEYLMLHNLGIKKGMSSAELQDKYKEESIVNVISKMILKGREVNKEPVDFNF